MPIKKNREDILYTEKSLSSNTPHPIKVGCGCVRVPLTISRKDKSENFSWTLLDVIVDLNPSIHGSNISKIIILINKEQNHSLFTLTNLLLSDGESKIFDKNIKISYEFVYFLRKKALVSSEESWSSYKTKFTIEKTENDIKYFLKTCVPYASLCPTSKDISDYGAHNQRSLAEIEVELADFNENCDFWVEDLVYIVDHCVSCPTFNVANFEDEAFQTEMMYENPMFVEDVALKIAKSMDKQKNKHIKGYSIVLNHYESINDYTVKAVLEGN